MGKTIQIETSGVYEKIIDAKDKKVIASEGGSRSTKTTSFLQYGLINSFNSKPFIFRTFREKLTWCKDTVLQDFNEICNRNGITFTPEFNPRRSDQDYIVNGSLFSFMGLDDIKRVHGLKQDYAFFNEANEMSIEMFNQVEQRTNIQMLLDWNPSFMTNNLIDSVLKRPDCAYVHSTMLDNPFLPDTIINKLLSYEPTPQNVINGTADDTYWKIYGLGVRAVNIGLIYPKYTIVKEMPTPAQRYGLDWGFTGSLALVGYSEFGDDVYLDEVIYMRDLTNPELVALMKDRGISISDLIICDSESPQNIKEVRNFGFNTVPCGVKDVLFNIKYTKGKRLHVTERSINIIKELQNYKWKDEKPGEKRAPVKAFDHSMNAFQYVCTYYATIPQHSTATARCK